MMRHATLAIPPPLRLPLKFIALIPLLLSLKGCTMYNLKSQIEPGTVEEEIAVVQEILVAEDGSLILRVRSRCMYPCDVDRELFVYASAETVAATIERQWRAPLRHTRTEADAMVVYIETLSIEGVNEDSSDYPKDPTLLWKIWPTEIGSPSPPENSHPPDIASPIIKFFTEKQEHPFRVVHKLENGEVILADFGYVDGTLTSTFRLGRTVLYYTLLPFAFVVDVALTPIMFPLVIIALSRPHH